MALESFYGGKPGISPVIRNSFKFIDKDDPAYIAKKNSSTPYSKLSSKEIALLEIVDPSLKSKMEQELNGSINWNNENYNYLKPFTMDECFADPNYRDVWYSELCIIDTDNKMNPNNGKIFRRTLKRTATAIGAGDTLYAEYIGQIVGPSGGIPRLDFGSLDAEREKAIGTRATYKTDEVSEEISLDTSTWEYTYKDNEGNISTAIPDEINDITISDSGDSANIQMVPGKGKDENNNDVYHDKIRYTWCNVRRTVDGENGDAWIYLGFEIPYTVFDIDIQKKSYRYNGDYLTNNSTMPEITDDNGNLIPNPNYHPFSKSYTFNIPRGTRGIGPEEIFIVGKDNKQKPTPLYSFDAIKYLSEKNNNDPVYGIDFNNTDNNDGIIIEEDNYYIPRGTEQINPSEKTYWVAKWTLYNPEDKFEPVVYQYLGSYKDIDEINIDTNLKIDDENNPGQKKENPNYGNVTIIYSNSDEVKKIATLPLIKNAEYDPSTGQITFEHAGGPERNVTTTNAISYVSNIQVLDDGTIQYQLNTESGNNTWHLMTKIKDIIEAKIATNENISNFTNGKVGHLYVKYRPDPNTWVDLGLVNINSTLGIVVQDTLKTDDESQETETIGSWLDELNAENGRRVIDNDSDTVILKTGEITVNGINKTGGFVAVTDNTDSDNPVTYLVYYDPHKGEWINGGTLSGEINSEYANGIYVQEQDENDQTTTIPAKNEKATFTFIPENITDSETSLLTMPWEPQNYGSQSNSSNNQEPSNSEESNSSNSG